MIGASAPKRCLYDWQTESDMPMLALWRMKYGSMSEAMDGRPLQRRVLWMVRTMRVRRRRKGKKRVGMPAQHDVEHTQGEEYGSYALEDEVEIDVGH